MMIFWLFLNVSTFIAFAVFMFSLLWTLLEKTDKKRWRVVLISGIVWLLLFVIVCFIMFSPVM